MSVCTYSEMAEDSFLQEEFKCSVCLDPLKDPVTIPCGHSYCLNCIADCWNRDDQTGVYRCPQCRRIFNPRPALYKNVMFAEVVEKLKKTQLQTARTAHRNTEHEDVECDICSGTKPKAIKSCLECMKSFCQNHFEQHENFFSGMRHNLMNPTRRLYEMICPTHNKQLEIYCLTDQQYVCYECMKEEHKNHTTVPVSAERTEKQRLSRPTKRKFQQIIQEKEKELQELRRSIESQQRSAQTAVEDSERIFSDLIRSIERRRSEVTQIIRDQEKSAVSRAEGVFKQLKQEIVDLRSRDEELEQLSHTDNDILFLQSFQSFSAALESTVPHSFTVSSLLSFDDLIKSVSQLKDKLENFCREEMEMMSDEVTNILSDEPKTRKEFLQYSRQMSLDSNTAYEKLSLFDGNRAATYTDTNQHYPDHPDRFDYWPQVLCRESVCGRCYWEVEWTGSDGVLISVSYKSINRKGSFFECIFGQNNQSWSLFCSPSNCFFEHESKCTNLSVSSSCSKIGVYVDHSAGTLSFYSVSDTMTLIHSIQTTFTQPLYPGFFVNEGSTVKVCPLIK